MSEPITPTDDQLAIIANNNPYLINALRALFEQAGTLSPSLIDEAVLAAGNAEASANQANASIEGLISVLQLIALTPNIEPKIQDDLTPPYQFIQPDTLTDLAPL